MYSIDLDSQSYYTYDPLQCIAHFQQQLKRAQTSTQANLSPTYITFHLQKIPVFLPRCNLLLPWLIPMFDVIQVSYKAICNFLSYPANKQTNKQIQSHNHIGTGKYGSLDLTHLPNSNLIPPNEIVTPSGTNSQSSSHININTRNQEH